MARKRKPSAAPPRWRDLTQEEKREALRGEHLLETFPDIEEFGTPHVHELPPEAIAAAHERLAKLLQLRANRDSVLASMDPAVAEVLAEMDPELFDRFVQFERVDCQTLDGEALSEARERLGPLYIGPADFDSFEDLQAAIDELAAAITAAKAKQPAPKEPDAGMMPEPIEERLLSRLRVRERLSSPLF